MNINCDVSCEVIMDLVAVYKDGLASDDTRNLVRTHLRACPDCRQLYAGYRAAEGIRPAACPPPPNSPVLDYSILARHMHRKHMLSTASMLSVLAVSSAVGIFSIIRLVAGDED